MSLCDVWLFGPNASSAPCSDALEDLIGALDREFSSRFDLTPADFDAAIGNVDELVAFVLVQPVARSFGRALFAAAIANPTARGTDPKRSIENAVAPVAASISARSGAMTAPAASGLVSRASARRAGRGPKPAATGTRSSARRRSRR
jgi:hypothetical protein